MHDVGGEVVDLVVFPCEWGSGGIIRWNGGGVFFGLGRVIREEKLGVGGGGGGGWCN